MPAIVTTGTSERRRGDGSLPGRGAFFYCADRSGMIKKGDASCLPACTGITTRGRPGRAALKVNDAGFIFGDRVNARSALDDKDNKGKKG